MEQIIDITNFIKNYSHYYQKISISLILAKSKKHSEWFCIFMKILLLRKEDNDSNSHSLKNKINKEYVDLRFYSLPINSLHEIVSDAINGRVKSDNKVYNFYNYNKSSSGSFHSSVTLEVYDNTIDYPGYIFSTSRPTGSFSKILHGDFMLTNSNIGINDYNFHEILRINDYSYFHTNMLFILFPLFIKEVSSDPKYKIYEIDHKLYSDIDPRLYDEKGIDFKNLIQIENKESTILKIPKNKIETKLNLIIYHKELAEIYSSQLDKGYNDSIDYRIISDSDIKSLNNFIDNSDNRMLQY